MYDTKQNRMGYVCVNGNECAYVVHLFDKQTVFGIRNQFLFMEYLTAL